MIHNLSKGAHFLLLVFLVLTFTICNNFFSLNNYFITYGLNWMWAVVLYFVGSYIRLHVRVEAIKMWKLIVLFLLICFFHTLVSSLLNYGIKSGNQFVLTMFGDEYTHFRRYNNLQSLFSAILFFLIFSKITIKNKISKKVISFISKHSLASYLVHCHPLTTYHFAVGAWQLAYEWGGVDGGKRWLAYFAFVGIIFIGSMLIDIVREYLFKLYNTTRWYKGLMAKIDDLPYNIIKRINDSEIDAVETQ